MINRFSIKTEYLVLILIAVLIVLSTFPVGEGDFYFHVKTGQWIWEHRSLPTRDPFNFPLQSHTFLQNELPWVGFVLKQYWLGQLLLYGVWSVSGEAGMVLLRSAAYGGIFLFLFWWLRRKGIGIAEVAVLFLGGNILLHYSAERPQLFAFVLLPLLLFLLESARKTAPVIPLTTVFCLPLTVFLWSNMHGSFVLALLIIALYALIHLGTAVWQKSPVDKKMLALLVGAILASLANPGGWKALAFSLNFLQMQASRTSEFTSPWTMLIQHHVIDYYYWLLVVTVVLMLLVNRRRVEIIHAAVVLGLLLLSFKGTRYIPFFALATPLVCFSLPAWRPGPRTVIALTLLLFTWAATADYRNIFKFRAEKSFPAAAAKFLATAHPAGNLFNYVTWGGYLLCYTDYPVFVDTRNLVEKFVAQHDSVLAAAGWQEILDSNSIQTIIVPGTDAISWRPYPLLLQLLQDPQWVLVFMDDVSLVLVRNSAANAQVIGNYALDKNSMTDHIQARWKWQMANTL